ncbi:MULTISPECIES: lipopolysaccharide biosynthesis protein [Gordonibacter]|uniref:Lipopolysaccharide biosynthesis protein n=1 Tax=Gordonibacter faecis TaxID=3047475 RepID=A0ABT7DL26_9ACTN|nr:MULTISPECIES: lipopolysaccharide biosynthesis protein [unclassified Gordonibacter]MDJ1650228.1 lipopolysaccharide biosynthesis protein [Gordonibacter sp. KGMB12511]
MKHLAKDSTTPAENAPEKERTVARHARPADTSADDAPASAPTFSPSDTTPFLGAAAREREQRASGKPPRKPNFITRTVNGWWNRLLGAVSEGSLASQEAEYAAHRTSRDYVWNTIGFAAWGMVFPILTVVVTQLVGVEQAGMFSLAFVTGMLLMIVANYGVRTFQVSDVDEAHSFSDYQMNRWITCAIMVLVGVGYCLVRGYETDMFTISLGVYLYKMIDGLADVYEGRLQQKDKLYLAGISQAFRSVLVLVVFSLVLLITRNLSVACIAMATAAAASFVLLTFPLSLFETPKSRRWSAGSVGGLFRQCFPLFIALFLYAFIDNMPKFVMEGVLSYDNQLYFNALYFPAQGILLTVGFIYKPLLVKMANVWADPEKRKRFDLIIVVIMLVVVGVTAATALMMAWIGIPVMGFLYGVDFEQFRGLCYIMLAAGGVTAAIDFLYQVITVLRRQKAVTTLYIITFGFALFVPILLVNFTGLPGAVIGYLIVMCILLVLLIWEYARIRIELARQDKAEVAAAAEPGVGRHLRPSEARAERERRAQVHAKWGTHEAPHSGKHSAPIQTPWEEDDLPESR